RLDNTPNHALLDDRITARAKPCAQEHIDHITAATARTIDKVVRASIQIYLTADRQLMVQIKLMAYTRLLILGMLKGQLNTGNAFGRFILRASKDDITHRPTA